MGFSREHHRLLRNVGDHTQGHACTQTPTDARLGDAAMQADTLAHAHTQHTHAHMPRVGTCIGSHQEPSSLRSANLVPLRFREARASERMNGTRRNILPFAQPLNRPAHELCSVFSAAHCPVAQRS